MADDVKTWEITPINNPADKHRVKARYAAIDQETNASIFYNARKENPVARYFNVSYREVQD